MREYRIVLDDRLLPVQAFFNAIPDIRFLEILKAFSKGIGAGINNVVCVFPGDLEPYEEPIQGVSFSIAEIEEVTLGYTEFMDILRKVSKIYVEDFPESVDTVDSLVNQVEALFEEPDASIFQPGNNVGD